MYGTLLTNAHVKELIRNRAINIEPFDEGSLKLAHYRLRPQHLVRPLAQRDDGTREYSLPVHDFRSGKPFRFEANEYLIATTIEHIILGPGIVGEVIPASTLVEQGFGIVAGKLDPGYGSIEGKPQDFIIGLKNLLDEPNFFFPGRGIANISFHDFRGTSRLPLDWSDSERSDFKTRRISRKFRRVDDDGVFYDDDL